MKDKRVLFQLILLGMLIVCVVLFRNNPFVLSGQPDNKAGEPVIENEQLRQDIETRAEEFNENPVDAYIDRVWKKTPGRNGLRVNIEKSYEKMKKSGIFDESLIVYDQVAPQVTLSDLPASPIYRGHPEKDMVALMINVSWGEEYIPSILEILKEHGVKATFFIEGKWAKENKELLEMIHEQNHLIGSHAYNHPDMARISTAEITDQIEKPNKIIEAIIGERPKWFAPPSGSFNDQVVKIAHDLEMQTILWTVDTIDWKNPSVSVMINRVMTNVHPGATILMHPTQPVVQGLSPMIEDLKREGYRLGTIDQLLNEER